MLRLIRQHQRAAWSLFSALIIGACADSATGPQGPPGEFVFSANVVGTTISTMVVEVTAPDISSPLAFNITIANGVANGTIKLPPGENRTITLRAFDNLGNETHEGSKTISVKPGQNPPVAIPVVSKAGQVTITATMGPVALTISAASTSILVGGTSQLTVTITGPNGDVISGPAAFATMNPSIASVDAAGLVTGVAQGSVQIVATYAGVGAGVTINVGQAPAPTVRIAVAGQTSLRVYDANTLALISTHPLLEPGYSADEFNGVVYVGSNNKIFAVNLASATTTILTPGLLGSVHGLAVSGGQIYATGSGMAHIESFNPDGTQAGLFFSPFGGLRSLAFGVNGQMYATSAAIFPVQYWFTGGAFAGEVIGVPPINSPYGIDARANGDMLVAASVQSQFHEFSANHVFQGSTQVNCVGELRDLAVDSAGNVWIACLTQNVVVKINAQGQEVGRIPNLVQPSGLAAF